MRLQQPPFAQYRDVLQHPSDYRASQALGSKMRDAGVEAFTFLSARDQAGGINLALFTPLALAQPNPVSQEPWLGELTGERVTFRAAHSKAIHHFPLETFQVGGKLPQPA
jgi:hypothetical protein